MHLGLISPFTTVISVTPDNDTDLPSGFISRGITVEVTGDVTFTNLAGVDSTANLVAGVIYPIIARRIKATGTDATGIQAWN